MFTPVALFPASCTKSIGVQFPITYTGTNWEGGGDNAGNDNSGGDNAGNDNSGGDNAGNDDAGSDNASAKTNPLTIGLSVGGAVLVAVVVVVVVVVVVLKSRTRKRGVQYTKEEESNIAAAAESGKADYNTEAEMQWDHHLFSSSTCIAPLLFFFKTGNWFLESMDPIYIFSITRKPSFIFLYTDMSVPFMWLTKLCFMV